MHIVDLFDKIRQYLMEKFDLRHSIAAATYVGHIIVPKVMKMLLLKSKKGLDMNIVKRSTFSGKGDCNLQREEGVEVFCGSASNDM